ncbi:MAG TPA: hypothetical protein VEW05_13900, partial [Candidatus Polarisedimenticolia bacterium]|nr:hypothetical protein [Candidatus Polarisedimenticolia bacterium]
PRLPPLREREGDPVPAPGPPSAGARADIPLSELALESFFPAIRPRQNRCAPWRTRRPSAASSRRRLRATACDGNSGVLSRFEMNVRPDIFVRMEALLAKWI